MLMFENGFSGAYLALEVGGGRLGGQRVGKAMTTSFATGGAAPGIRGDNEKTFRAREEAGTWTGQSCCSSRWLVKEQRI